MAIVNFISNLRIDTDEFTYTITYGWNHNFTLEIQNKIETHVMTTIQLNKIEAVKFIRVLGNLGLKEAHDLICRIDPTPKQTEY
jgi:hypothetical protein